MNPSFRLSRAGVALLCVLSLLPAVLGAQSVVHPLARGGWTWQFIGNLRVRGEDWNWFTPASPANGQYAFGASTLRLGVGIESPRLGIVAEAEQPALFGLPDDAVATAPQGQLGFGAAYRVANQSQKAAVFLKQGFVTFHSAPGHTPWSVRGGRFDFNEGRETQPLDPGLAALKSTRVAERMIGSFGFTHVGRSFDGFDVRLPVLGGTLAAMAAHPTQGVFNLDGMHELNVDLGYLALTRAVHGRDVKGKSVARGEARLFGIYYHDGRDVAKTDNRSARPANDATRHITIYTLGGNYLSTFPLGAGKVDALVWGAWQTGQWGPQRHSAYAVAAEVGYRPVLTGLKPWIRVGYQRSSGDGSPDSASTHSTFFQVLPTPRPFARFPFYNMMNMQDRFIQLSVNPHPRLMIRSDVHSLRLANAADRWYAGGGAYEDASFGYAGRPSQGGRDLATLVDLSVDFRLWVPTTVSLYAGRAIGKEVIRSTYPRGANASYIYLEIVHKF